MLDALEAVHSDGKANMLDVPAVLPYLYHDYAAYSAIEWIIENRERYVAGIFEGFTAVADEGH